ATLASEDNEETLAAAEFAGFESERVIAPGFITEIAQALSAAGLMIETLGDAPLAAFSFPTLSALGEIRLVKELSVAFDADVLKVCRGVPCTDPNLPRNRRRLGVRKNYFSLKGTAWAILAE